MHKVKNHLIGGITGGIGSELAVKLSAEGDSVSGYARKAAVTDSFSSQGEFKLKTCDATDPEALETVINEFQNELGSIDSYTHAIGSIYLRPAHLTPIEDWLQTIETNLSSAFYALRIVTKVMSKQGHGSCLFFSTAAAQTGIANHEAIAAAKGGIEAMVRAAAASYTSRGLRINAVAPSLTDTPLSQPIVGSEQALEISKRMHPTGDIGEASDVASLAAWLHSDQAKFVTGQTFVIDGGISKIVPKPKA
ncbi:MAG: SDR family oxidoreductase [Verrucomicrobiota bacterium]|nr:SDR family oxidoreductase [Verrucomicrobiota bacterium]